MDKDNQQIAVEIAQKNGFDVRDVRELLDCDTSPEETVELLKKKVELAEKNRRDEALEEEQKRWIESEKEKRKRDYRLIAAEEWYTGDGNLNETLNGVIKVWNAVFVGVVGFVLLLLVFGGTIGLIWGSCVASGLLSAILGLLVLPYLVAGVAGFTIYCYIDEEIDSMKMPKWLLRRVMRFFWRRAFINSDKEPNSAGAFILPDLGMKPRIARRLVKRKRRRFKAKAKIKAQEMLRRKVIEKYCEVTLPNWFEQKQTKCYEIYDSVTQSVKNVEVRKILLLTEAILIGGGLLPAILLWVVKNNLAAVAIVVAMDALATIVIPASLYATICLVRPIRLWLDKKENPMFEELVKTKIRNNVLYGKRDPEEQAVQRVAQESPAR
ncbi:hypothetical protein IKT64_00105 [Candidatus Saccharibacteria bacterium]|nr:hypothetical protein [Candidatus Saccharibacteria bacterium]